MSGTSPRADNHHAADEQIFTLARGFSALLEITQKLTSQERRLQDRLRFAYEEYSKLAKQFCQPTNDYEARVARHILHGERSNGVDREETYDAKGWIREVEDSGYITGSEVTALVEGVDVYERIAGQLPRDGDGDYRAPNDCLVAAEAQRGTAMERDFTTNGVNGKLQCPFAKLGESNRAVGQVEDAPPNACGRDELDPIKAEFRSSTASAAPMSGQSAAAGAAARCPIRYLDDHSPEALATYFENHKHEIPRSHAVCIQRYQGDSHSMRFLDEKYGDLANMVKGLGKYHQPYLSSAQGGPDATHREAQRPGASSTERVENWAEEVGTSSGKGSQGHPPTEEAGAGDENERGNHFDRPLRDVRVGESPSRPWGIHVPLSAPARRSSLRSPVMPASASDAAQEHLLQDNKSSTRHFSVENNPKVDEQIRPAGTGRCPFDMGRTLSAGKEPNAEERPKTPRANPTRTTTNGIDVDPEVQPQDNAEPNHISGPQPSVQPRVVFNGPVFFGYNDPQSVATLLDKLGTQPKG